MSLLSDFFVATPDEAARYPADDLPIEVFQSTGFTGLELELLWAILAGEPWSAERHALEPVGAAAREGPWLHRLPAPFVDRLVGLAPPALASIAAQWLANEELIDVGDAAAQHVLRELHALAGTAHRQARGLYLFVSL
jgi:hypothetical protein